MIRRIAHLDMDAFYASVELLRYPELRGQPVVIGGGRRYQPEPLANGSLRFARLADYAGRGVSTTATYEARAYGVNSAMPLARAARLCPQAVLLPTDFDEYRKYSRLFKAAVRASAPTVEDRGIDEIYIDLSALPGVAADGGRSVALALKRAVREATGLSCSIGVAPNKLLAKLASELDKPDGLTLIDLADLPTRIWPLPASRINGIGPKAAARLKDMGIHTIGELAQFDPARLVERFGRATGAWLHDAAHGRDARAVVTRREPKSMSRETTFERDLHPVRDRERLSEVFTALCEQVAADLQRKGYVGRTIGIKLRYDDFSTLTRDHTLESYTDEARAIRRAAGACLKRVPLERRLRLLGVRVGALLPAAAARPAEAAPEALSLFD
ncbi:MAG: DNA polymerase IV [Betaproteobacteria bacterium]|nr:DNA polymerase IV [Betaproteobacteria bacterium]